MITETDIDLAIYKSKLNKEMMDTIWEIYRFYCATSAKYEVEKIPAFLGYLDAILYEHIQRKIEKVKR